MWNLKRHPLPKYHWKKGCSLEREKWTGNGIAFKLDKNKNILLFHANQGFDHNQALGEAVTCGVRENKVFSENPCPNTRGTEWKERYRERTTREEERYSKEESSPVQMPCFHKQISIGEIQWKNGARTTGQP